ncbi:RNA polymerase sigma factor [Pedobacter frigiditerrae]|uniref:RNA polymerase sigma factor n=1 Tax=Pedobacter frigiditerrae TaxID=2530452 RepID=A0A4R0MN32_9SPHI|nr:RNA polymerase sigma factor [Pedobacter frigiditerrae]TCC88033.1 RNA polymerase sigma factor [Pedobacter frigiditerrae]
MQTFQLNDVLSEHRPHLRSFAYKFTKDDSEADDLIQDTMLKAMRYADKFIEGTNLKAWLFTIMRNTFINDYRKETRKNAVVTQEDEISNAHLMTSATKNEAEGKFAMADIQKTLSKLPKCYYDPFIQYFEGYKYHEIAEDLNIPIGTVKTRIHMARQILQKQLKVYRK